MRLDSEQARVEHGENFVQQVVGCTAEELAPAVQRHDVLKAAAGATATVTAHSS